MNQEPKNDNYEKLDEINHNIKKQLQYQKDNDYKDRMDNRKVNLAIMIAILTLIIVTVAFPKVSDSKISVLISALAFFIAAFKAILKW